jgi:hypothetical protein
MKNFIILRTFKASLMKRKNMTIALLLNSLINNINDVDNIQNLPPRDYFDDILDDGDETFPSSDEFNGGNNDNYEDTHFSTEDSCRSANDDDVSSQEYSTKLITFSHFFP